MGVDRITQTGHRGPNFHLCVTLLNHQEVQEMRGPLKLGLQTLGDKLCVDSSVLGEETFGNLSDFCYLNDQDWPGALRN